MGEILLLIVVAKFSAIASKKADSSHCCSQNYRGLIVIGFDIYRINFGNLIIRPTLNAGICGGRNSIFEVATMFGFPQKFVVAGTVLGVVAMGANPVQALTLYDDKATFLSHTSAVGTSPFPTVRTDYA